MSKFIQSVCPLCRSQAQCMVYPIRHTKHFLCNKCTSFVIKNSAEAWLLQSVAKPKDDYSEAAADAPRGKVLFIFQAPSSDPKVRYYDAKYLPLEDALHQ